MVLDVFNTNLVLNFVCSGVLDHSSCHDEAQPPSGSLHPHPFPVVMGYHQRLFPAKHIHEISADR